MLARLTVSYWQNIDPPYSWLVLDWLWHDHGEEGYWIRGKLEVHILHMREYARTTYWIVKKLTHIPQTQRNSTRKQAYMTEYCILLDLLGEGQFLKNENCNE